MKLELILKRRDTYLLFAKRKIYLTIYYLNKVVKDKNFDPKKVDAYIRNNPKLAGCGAKNKSKYQEPGKYFFKNLVEKRCVLIKDGKRKVFPSMRKAATFLGNPALTSNLCMITRPEYSHRTIFGYSARLIKPKNPDKK